MFKKQYIMAQKELLEAIPVNPYELTEQGIRELRKSIVVSVLSLAVCLVMSLVVIRWALAPDGMASSGLTFMFGKLVGLLAILLLALWGLSKSSDYLLGTGLYWQLSVSDELQDEWELAQKRRSYTKAFEYVLLGACALFVLMLVYCGLYYAFNGALPNPPSFGVSLIIFGMLIYIAALAPIIHIAWTLVPIEVEEGASGRPVTRQKGQRAKPLTQKQKWLKRLWSWGPIFIGAIIGVTWAMNG